jgi:uncharacterized protein (TIGR00369 family)
MMQALGVRLMAVAPGTVTLALPYSDRVTQQQGGFHGGAMGALADIAGGYAALTVAPEGMEVTTVEYKINFIAAAGRRAAGHRQVSSKPGKRIIVTSAEWCMWRPTANAALRRDAADHWCLCPRPIEHSPSNGDTT